MQTRSSDENSVCQTCDLWQNERKLCPHSYTTWKTVSPSFMTRRMVGWGWPLLPKILGQPAFVGVKSAILNRYSLLAPQPYHLAKKSSLTLIGTTTHFPMSPRWSSYVAPKLPKGGLKNAKRRFWWKIALCLKKVCYSFFVWKLSATKL